MQLTSSGYLLPAQTKQSHRAIASGRDPPSPGRAPVPVGAASCDRPRPRGPRPAPGLSDTRVVNLSPRPLCGDGGPASAQRGARCAQPPPRPLLAPIPPHPVQRGLRGRHLPAGEPQLRVLKEVMGLVSGSVNTSGQRAGGPAGGGQSVCGARASLPVWRRRGPRGGGRPQTRGRSSRRGPCFGRAHGTLQAPPGCELTPFPYTRPTSLPRVAQRPVSGPGTWGAGRRPPQKMLSFGNWSRDAGWRTACQLPGKQDTLTGRPAPATPGCFQVQRAT